MFDSCLQEDTFILGCILSVSSPKFTHRCLSLFLHMQERLEAKIYLSVEDFRRDFDLLFSQVQSSFPPGHAAVRELVKIQSMFANKMARIA
jgi:hypothetical protein